MLYVKSILSISQLVFGVALFAFSLSLNGQTIDYARETLTGDLTKIGLEKSISLEGTDLSGASKLPDAWARGKNLDGAILPPDLSNSRLNEATSLKNMDASYVKVLPEEWMKKGYKDQNGNTPLHLATSLLNKDLLHIILENSEQSELLALDDFGNTPISMLIKNMAINDSFKKEFMDLFWQKILKIKKGSLSIESLPLAQQFAVIDFANQFPDIDLSRLEQIIKTTSFDFIQASNLSRKFGPALTYTKLQTLLKRYPHVDLVSLASVSPPKKDEDFNNFLKKRVPAFSKNTNPDLFQLTEAHDVSQTEFKKILNNNTQCFILSGVNNDPVNAFADVKKHLLSGDLGHSSPFQANKANSLPLLLPPNQMRDYIPTVVTNNGRSCFVFKGWKSLQFFYNKYSRPPHNLLRKKKIVIFQFAHGEKDYVTCDAGFVSPKDLREIIGQMLKDHHQVAFFERTCYSGNHLQELLADDVFKQFMENFCMVSSSLVDEKSYREESFRNTPLYQYTHLPPNSSLFELLRWGHANSAIPRSSSIVDSANTFADEDLCHDADCRTCRHMKNNPSLSEFKKLLRTISSPQFQSQVENKLTEEDKTRLRACRNFVID